MRNTWIVTYDIGDPKRLRRVFECCKGRGIHLQYSVFQCELDRQEKVQFVAVLNKEINQHQDQILFIDLGPTERRGERIIQSLGLPYIEMDEACYAI